MSQPVRTLTLWLAAVLTVAGLSLLSPAAASAPVDGAPVGTLAASPRTWEVPGPYAVTVAPRGTTHTLYYPTNLGAGGVQHPILIWGNGTGATVAEYEFALKHLASWGFVVAAANTGQSGSGAEMLDGARFLIAEDKRVGSPFYGKLDETKVGASGHSQGGGGAVVVGADPLVDTTVPIQPGPQGNTTELRGPAFFIAGQNDWIVPSFYVRSRYSWATQVPAVFGELRGADHFFPGETRTRVLGPVTAWFRFWLMGDEATRGVFFGTPFGLGTDTDAWSATARNAKATAIPG
jgi:pimeloyl-ACP methyl ester carboxylesterase